MTQTQIVELLRTLNRRHGTGLLYISHDLVSVLQLCERMLVLEAGTLVESLSLQPLAEPQHPASRALLASLPVPANVLMGFRTPPGVAHDTPPDRSLSSDWGQPQTRVVGLTS